MLTTTLAIAGVSVLAQGKYNVKGTIIDKETSEAVVGATIQLLSLPDSSFVTGSIADADGSFTFTNLSKKKYTLKMTSVGYLLHYIDINIDGKKKDTDLGYLTLVSDARMLKEVEVVANAAKMQVSGDSLVYNASAYRVPEGSTLEALVKLLPGAKVDDDGNITINGKTVNKILVDGKEFFLNDKNVAMKNIPTDMIDKIKSYERKSDMARVTGIDDGEEETVLDLSVKKGMKNGWFGNLNAGGGTKERYDSRGMVNRFNDNVQMSVLGNARNTPNRWGWGNNGLITTKEVGANFATTSTKLETGGSVRYNYRGTNVISESSSENFVAERGRFSENKNKSISSNGTVNSNFKFEWKPDTMTNIIFRPNLSFSRNRGMNYNRSGQYDSNPNDITENVLDYNDEIALISNDPSIAPSNSYVDQLLDIVANTNTSRSQSYNKNVNLNGELQLNRKLNSTGRNITLRMTGAYGEGQSKQLSAANITYNTLGTTRQNNRYYSTPSANHSYSAQLTYNEPIADRTYLQFSYQYNYSYSRNDRRAQVYESFAYQDLTESLQRNRYDIDAILRFMDEMQYVMRDSTELDRFSEYRNYNQTISAQLRRVRENYNFSVGVDALPQHTKLNYRNMGLEFPEVTRSVFNFAPRARLRWNFSKNTNMRFRYNGRTSQPSMTNLLDITDDSDPLNISKGNPGLKPSFSHNFNGNFNTYSPEKQRGMWVWSNGSVTNNSIANKTTYDRETGVRTTMPMNINGNWNIGGGGGINTAIDEQKLFSVGMNVGGRYNHNVGFYNNVNANQNDDTDIKSITNNTQLNGGLNGNYRDSNFSIELRGNLNYSHITNNVNVNGNQNTYNFSYGTEVTWNMPWGTELATDMFMNSRRGYSVSNMNTNELIWNASLSQSFLKGKALTIKAEVFDILGQQTNITRTVNAFSRSDSRSNTIYQYGMVTAIFRFSIFAGKNTMGTDQEKGNNNQWQGRRRW